MSSDVSQGSGAASTGIPGESSTPRAVADQPAKIVTDVLNNSDSTPQQKAAKAAKLTATTPAWVLRSISVVVVGISPFLAHWSVFSKNPTGAQAGIVIVCLVIAASIFTVQVALAAVHEYGFSRAALGEVATAEQKEITALWPGIKSNWAKAEPVVNETLPKLS